MGCGDAGGKVEDVAGYRVAREWGLGSDGGSDGVDGFSHFVGGVGGVDADKRTL